MRLKRTLLACSAALAVSATVQAQGNDALRDAAQKAVASNPDVTARYNALRAAGDAIDVARGAWLPRVDLQAVVGRVDDRITTRVPPNDAMTHDGLALQVVQTLWDGLATRNDVDRLGHERLARYFEFVEATEQAALEAARAHYDVLRYRRLVGLAEDNYVQHKYAYTQIESRVRAGVGRGVDLEQSGARLALAESNLATEVANLHDVVARYQRIVGEAPPARLSLPTALRSGVPATAAEVVAAATARSAAVSASIENLRAARSAATLRESAFQPRIEARARAGAGRNFDALADQRRDTSADLTLSWNLFNGGADRARVRQAANLLAQAADVRDRTCRDVRQTALIAYNDARKLAEQMTLLDRNVIAIEKARDAYAQQFEINQRSLLDLLNAENELYTARRALANAEHDLGISQVRTQAALQQLTVQLGLRRIDADQPLADAAGWAADGDAPSRCPLGALDITPTQRGELDARAQRMAASAPPPAAPASAPRR